MRRTGIAELDPLTFRVFLVLFLASLVSSDIHAEEKKAIPPCAQLAGKAVTLRGMVTKAWDNMSPDTDFGDEVVVDPMEEVVLVTLRSPLCTMAEMSTDRPVVEADVTTVEVVLDDHAIAGKWRSHAGKMSTIEGILSVNVWWHYRATLRIAATGIR